MKKLLMFFALTIGVLSCGSGDNTAAAKSPEKDRVEVIYFHGKPTLCHLHGYREKR